MNLTRREQEQLQDWATREDFGNMTARELELIANHMTRSALDPECSPSDANMFFDIASSFHRVADEKAQEENA